MKILVTGGLGFIGSHTVVELQNKGFDVVIIDNLSNSSESVLKGIVAITGKEPQFEKLDLREKASAQAFFKKHNDVSSVIHFAASKAVGESVKNPLLYYENNIASLIYLLQELQEKTEEIIKLQQDLSNAKDQNTILQKICDNQTNSDKALSDAQSQIDKLQKIIENIATKAVDKPTTNTTFNQIRNNFSDKHFLENIKAEEVKRKCQTNFT